jgi:hypothetical protein
MPAEAYRSAWNVSEKNPRGSTIRRGVMIKTPGISVFVTCMEDIQGADVFVIQWAAAVYYARSNEGKASSFT